MSGIARDHETGLRSAGRVDGMYRGRTIPRAVLGLMVGLMLGGVACDDDAGTRLDGTHDDVGVDTDTEVGPADVMVDGSPRDGKVSDGPIGDGARPDVSVEPDGDPKDDGVVTDGPPLDLAPDACPPIPEECNGLDDDCDGNIDEDAPGRACYSGPEGSRDVGICVSGWQICVAPADAPADPAGSYGPCEGEVLPEDGETCDGRDENCDGVVDMVVDAEDPERSVPLCGEMVATQCRIWMGWTNSELLDPGEELGRSFDTWFTCPGAQEQTEGNARCANTRFDQGFRSMPLPEGLLLGTDDKIGMMWECPGAGMISDEMRAFLGRVKESCRVSIAEDYENDGDAVSDAWPPCDAMGEALWGIEGRSRCTSTHQLARWRGLQFGIRFGENTDLGIALRCLSDDPMLMSVQRQVAIGLGWAERFDPPEPEPEPPADPPLNPHPWGDCADDTPLNDGPVRCVSTSGDGRFHRLQIGADLSGGAANYDPGIFGFALRARSAARLIDEARADGEAEQ